MSSNGDVCADTEPMVASAKDNLCEICKENDSKYKCPRCHIRTCSLSCCVTHKSKFDCTGVCEAVIYRRREEYGVFDFQRDYRLLEDIDRKNAYREKKLMQLTQKQNARVRKRKQLLKMASEYGITLRLAASSVLARSMINTSHVDISEDGQKTIYWSVEFNLLPNEAARTGHLTTQNLKSLNPLSLVVNEWEQRTRLCTIWNDRILNLSAEEQDKLVKYAPPGSPPFGKVTSWLHEKLNKISINKYYFYVQVQQVGVSCHLDNNKSALSRRFHKVEIFPTNRLINILITPGLIVHEMPTIWVSKFEITNTDVFT